MWPDGGDGDPTSTGRVAHWRHGDCDTRRRRPNVTVTKEVSLGRITVVLADDNLIVREGVRALLALEPDIEVVAVAADYDELLAQACATEPAVLVTDIRMPPSFQREGIEAAKEVRKRYPGTGVVVLSQY